MGNGGKKIRLSFNSPVILGFTLACFIVLILDKVTGSASTRAFFSVYRSSLASPFTYIRFFGHVLGHASWDHFFGNIMMLLVVGPLLEEKYGSANIHGLFCARSSFPISSETSVVANKKAL